MENAQQYLCQHWKYWPIFYPNVSIFFFFLPVLLFCIRIQHARSYFSTERCYGFFFYLKCRASGLSLHNARMRARVNLPPSLIYFCWICLRCGGKYPYSLAFATTERLLFCFANIRRISCWCCFCWLPIRIIFCKFAYFVYTIQIHEKYVPIFLLFIWHAKTFSNIEGE